MNQCYSIQQNIGATNLSKRIDIAQKNFLLKFQRLKKYILIFLEQ